MVDKKKLLQDKDAVEEINRYKWLQGEMVGYDIGFEQAANDWCEKYAEDWLAAQSRKKRN